MNKYLTTFLITIGIFVIGNAFMAKKKIIFYETVSTEIIEKQIASEACTNVYVYSDTCAKCRYLKEKININNIDKKSKKIYGINLDIGKNLKFLKQYQVVSTPVLLKISKGGEVLDRSEQVEDKKDVLTFFGIFEKNSAILTIKRIADVRFLILYLSCSTFRPLNSKTIQNENTRSITFLRFEKLGKAIILCFIFLRIGVMS